MIGLCHNCFSSCVQVTINEDTSEIKCEQCCNGFKKTTIKKFVRSFKNKILKNLLIKNVYLIHYENMYRM